MQRIRQRIAGVGGAVMLVGNTPFGTSFLLYLIDTPMGYYIYSKRKDTPWGYIKDRRQPNE